VKAWISVSKDPSRGTYQKAEDFYNNLAERFNRLLSLSTPMSDAMRATALTKKREDRPTASVKSKWYEIQKHVNKFVGISTTTDRPSGASEDNNHALLLSTFEARNKNSKFKYLTQWKYLKDKPSYLQPTVTMQPVMTLPLHAKNPLAPARPSASRCFKN
jgi:hypothetical protein